MSLKALLGRGLAGVRGTGEARGATSWPIGAGAALGLPPKAQSPAPQVSRETPLLGRGPTWAESAVPWGHLRVSSHDPTFQGENQPGRRAGPAFILPSKSSDISYESYVIIIKASGHMHWRRQWHPTPVLLPGKSHGRRSLVGCSPWGG